MSHQAHQILIACDPPRQTHQSRLRAYRIGKFCRIVKAKPDAATQALSQQIFSQLLTLRKGQQYLFPQPTAVHCSITWGFPFPASVKAADRKHSQWRTQRPDLDNLSKTVLDALTDAGAWEDDAQVSLLTLAKFNSPSPSVSITLNPHPIHIQ